MMFRQQTPRTLVRRLKWEGRGEVVGRVIVRLGGGEDSVQEAACLVRAWYWCVNGGRMEGKSAGSGNGEENESMVNRPGRISHSRSQFASEVPLSLRGYTHVIMPRPAAKHGRRTLRREV